MDVISYAKNAKAIVNCDVKQPIQLNSTQQCVWKEVKKTTLTLR